MSKASILAAVRANKPGPRPHPGTLRPERPASGAAAFAAAAALSKSKTVLHDDGAPLGELVTQLHPTAERLYVHPEVLARFPDLESLLGRQVIEAVSTPQVLADIHLAILPARCGVCENGACWLDDDCVPHRALPFSTEHLLLVVERASLVPTMHDAYARFRTSGFGVFIAGPSKTADIEQSLVIGAQGPRSLTVVLV